MTASCATPSPCGRPAPRLGPVSRPCPFSRPQVSVTNEAPHPVAERMHAEGFRPPLDAVDGAARVCDPVFTGITTGQNAFGKFFKDYREIPW